MREDAAGDATVDANTRTPGAPSPRNTPRRRSRTTGPALLAAVILIVLTLTVLPYACADPGAHVFANVVNVAVAGDQFQASATATKSSARTSSTKPSPTTTVAPGSPGALELVSPANAQGPVGANLTLSGSSWDGVHAGQTVSLSASATTCAASGTTSLGQAQLNSDGGFTANVVWPASLATTGTAYALCATSDGVTFATAPQSYRVRSAMPPALALSLPTVSVGQSTQIGGANFVGAASVTVTLTTAQGPRALATVTPDPKDGSFTLTYTPAAKDLGSASLSATSAPDGDAPPAMQASAQFQIVAAAPTVTAAPTATRVASAPPAVASSTSSSSLASTVLLAVGSLLFVLLLIGAVAWMFLNPVRSRPRRTRAARLGHGLGHGPGGSGAWGLADSSFDFAPPHPLDDSLDDSVAGSASHPTLYPHDAPTFGPAREWGTPPRVGVSPRAARSAWASSSANATPPARRSHDTWAAAETTAQPASPHAPGSLGLPSLDSGASQPNTSDATGYGEQRWDR